MSDDMPDNLQRWEKKLLRKLVNADRIVWAPRKLRETNRGGQ